MRRGAAILFIAAITGIQAYYAILSNPRRFWPFEKYDMFDDLRLWPSAELPWIYGVRSDGSEFRLIDPAHYNPILPNQATAALSGQEPGEAGNAAREVILAYLLSRYRALKAKGLHDGEDIAGIRLYRLRWDWKDGIGPEEPVPKRKLLAEYFGK